MLNSILFRRTVEKRLENIKLSNYEDYCQLVLVCMPSNQLFLNNDHAFNDPINKLILSYNDQAVVSSKYCIQYLGNTILGRYCDKILKPVILI